MGDNALVSIIIPVYNTRPYLARCLDSVLSQTYGNIEVICVDDGSTDGSSQILDEYGKKDGRIRVIHNEQGGVVKARNTALECLSGEYIGFVDADDYVKDNYIETLLNGFENEDIDMVTGGFFYAYDDHTRQIKNKKEVPAYPMPAKEFMRYMYERDTYRGVSGYLWTRLIRRSLLSRGEELRFNPDYETTDDILFVANLVCRSKNIVYKEEPLYFYYQREGSIVHNDERNLRTLVWIRTWKKAAELYYENDFDDESIEIVERMLVYRGGKLLEIAKRYNDFDAADKILRIIEPYIPVYERTNKDNPERVEWLKDLTKFFEKEAM